MLRVRNLCFDDLRKVLGLEACAADKTAVDLGHGFKPCGILGIHAAAVENTGMPGKLEAVELGYDLADCADSAVCFLVGGGLARADRPNGLVCDNYALSGFLFNALIERTNLGSEEGIGNACFGSLSRRIGSASSRIRRCRRRLSRFLSWR